MSQFVPSKLQQSFILQLQLHGGSRVASSPPTTTVAARFPHSTARTFDLRAPKRLG